MGQQDLDEVGKAGGAPADPGDCCVPFELRGEIQHTDTGNARLLVEKRGRDLHWCGTMPGDGWLLWDGCRWRADDTLGTTQIAGVVAGEWRARARKAPTPDEARKHGKWADRCESAAALRDMLNLARSEPGIAVRAALLDHDGMLLNTPDATYDLRTGMARKHRRADLITRCTAVAPSSTGCPVWLRFLDRIMGGDQEMIEFLRRAVGYSLTGETSEHCLFILHGGGRNGKSTFVEAIRGALGEFAKNTPIETFTAKREGTIPNDLAALVGARFVTAGESQDGAALNEGLVKLATGGDMLSARFLRQEFFDFVPAFKLWLSTNHKPTVRGTDEGVWRRLRLIPFEVTIPESEVDHGLAAKLRAEAPGILRWALDGCVEWRAGGLRPPSKVLAATRAYREEQNPIGDFLADRCLLGTDKGPTAHRELHAAYLEWCRDEGRHPLSSKRLGSEFTAQGIALDPRNGAGRRRSGIALLAPARGNEDERPADDRWSPAPGTRQ